MCSLQWGTIHVLAWLQVFIILLGISSDAFAKAPRTVIVGSLGIRPIAFTSSGNGWVGLSVTVLDEIATQEAWTITRVTAPWRELLKKLESGEIDILEGITYTAKRAKRFEFSNQSLMNNWGVIYAPVGTSISSILDLNGKTIAASGRSSHTEALIRLATEFGVNFTSLPTSGFSGVFHLLSQGKADVGLVSRTFGIGQGEKFGLLPTPIVLDPSEVRYAAPKGTNRDLLAAIDRYLIAAKAEPSSAYNRALIQWLGGSTKTEIPAWLKEAMVIFIICLIFTVFFIFVLRYQLKKRTFELASSEMLLRSIIDNAPASINLRDLDGRYLLVNNAFAVPRGVPLEALIGATVHNTTTEHADAAAAHMQKIIESGEIVVEERNVTLPDGTPYQALITKFPVFDTKGLLTSIGSIGIDITERKHAEQEAAEKSNLLQNIFDATPAFISLRDINGAFIFINDLMAAEMGMSLEEVLGKTPTDIFGVVSGETVEALVSEVIKLKKPIFQREIKSKRRTGRFYRYSVVPMFEDNGDISGALAIGQDITELKRTEREVAEKTGLLQTILDATPELISLRDIDGRFVFVNKHMAADIGMRPDDAIGKTHPELHGEVPGLTIQKLAMEVLESKQPILERELSLPRRPGRTHRYSIIPVFKDSGDISSVLSIGTDITDLRQAEMSLRESQEQTRMAFDAMPILVAYLDANERYLMMNKKGCEWFARTEAEIIGKTIKEIHGAAYEKLKPAIRRVLSGETLAYESSMRYPDGVTRDIRINTAPKFGTDNIVLGWVVMVEDITERKQAEDSLRESEAVLRSVMDNSPTVITLANLEGRLELVNEAFLTLFDVTREEVIGRSDKVNLLERHAETMAAHEAKVYDTEHAVTEERIDTMPSGEILSRLVTKFPVRNANGEISGVGTITTNISDLRKAEEDLRTLEARLGDILRIAPEVIISTDMDGEILMFNDAAENTFGYERGDMIGQSIDVLLPEHLSDAHGRHIKAFVEGADIQRLMGGRGEISGRRRDGSIFPADASISKLQSGGETILTVTMHDITDRRQAEEDLRQALVAAERANQAKTEFLATMSHELRTPLNAIIGFSETMAGQYFGALGSKKYVEYANDIGNSGEHLLHLINDLLDLSTIEAGKHELHKESLNFQEVIQECAPIVIERAGGKQIVYVVDASPDLPPIEADRRAIKQILLNVLSNSIKFTPEGGRVTLTATASKNAITIEIRDTGTGIPNEKLATLTDPFVRGESDPYKSQEGTGLGLAIVKSLVNLHDGDLTIESEVGVGTTVTVKLPIGDD
jgi:PAS domain S-box-containing protein